MIDAVSAVALTVGAVLAWPTRSRWAAPSRGRSRRHAGRPHAGRWRARWRTGRPGATAVEVADAVTLLALAMRGGRSCEQAVQDVASHGPLGVRADLAQVAAALSWGLPDEQAWQLVPPAWSGAGTALAVARQAGIAPAGLLDQAAEELRARSRGQLDQKVARLGVLLVLPLGFAFLPAFILTTVVPVVLTVARQALHGVP